MMEYFDVSHEFLLETIEKYRSKYEEFTILDSYIVYFEPTQNQDSRLQEIIRYYDDMTDEGKNLLLGQAQFYYQQFPKPKTNARAM